MARLLLVDDDTAGLELRKLILERKRPPGSLATTAF